MTHARRGKGTEAATTAGPTAEASLTEHGLNQPDTGAAPHAIQLSCGGRGDVAGRPVSRAHSLCDPICVAFSKGQTRRQRPGQRPE